MAHPRPGGADTRAQAANGRLIGANRFAALEVVRAVARNPGASSGRDDGRCEFITRARTWRRTCWRKSERLWANLQGLGVRRLAALALIGVAVFAVTGLAGYYLSRPTMETLYSGPRPRRRRRHRRGAARSGRRLRRQRREHGRPDAGRPGGDGAHDPRRKGPAAQRRGRQRTVRQARLARPDLVHAGRHAPAGARGRARAHDPDDALGQGGARPYRARRRRLVPPRAPAVLGLGGHPHRRRRRSRDRAGDPPPRRRRGSRT